MDEILHCCVPLTLQMCSENGYMSFDKIPNGILEMAATQSTSEKLGRSVSIFMFSIVSIYLW